MLGVGQPPVDPVVELKKQELELRAKADQADAVAKDKKLAIDEAKLQQDTQVDQSRIQSQIDIADERADIARERLAIMEQQMLGQTQGDSNA
jgi:Mg2+ and Co2+ transporter CorA